MGRGLLIVISSRGGSLHRAADNPLIDYLGKWGSRRAKNGYKDGDVTYALDIEAGFAPHKTMF
jgi:hypothetical protein